jgi:chitosanase
MRLTTFVLATELVWITTAQAAVVQTAVDQSAVMEPGPLKDTLPAALKACAERMISVFENESTALQYNYVENLNDGRGFTAGRAGFVTRDGDLLQVVELYNRMRPSNALSGFLPMLRTALGTASTEGLEALPAAWRKAASDPLFRQAQDQVSDRLYYVPAMQAADDLHLRSPLAKFALYDASIQHGAGNDSDSLGAIIRATIAVRGRPDKAGEGKWLATFLQTRKKVLLNATDPRTRAAWKESVGRVNEQLRLLREGNLQLSGPLTLKPYGRKFVVSCAPPPHELAAASATAVE